MQKTCRLKEKKNPTTALRGDWHKAGGLLLLSARAPRTEPDPGSEDWARPRLRPRPRPRPRGSARPLPAGPGRRRRHSLFPARKRTRHNRLFIYGGFFGVCAVCLGLVFSFFFFPPVLKSDFGIFLHSFASLAFVPSASGECCGAPGETCPHLRGARFAFPPSRFFFQHCGLLRMVSRNMRSCALDKKKTKPKRTLILPSWVAKPYLRNYFNG